MLEPKVLIPGDVVPSGYIPARKSSKPLTLGPGLHYIPPSTVSATLCGTLHRDLRKNALWLEASGGRYTPSSNDVVIATVQRSTPDFYICSLTPYGGDVLLPQLAFEGASKKTRPQLVPGSLVYARVSAARRDMDSELSCVYAGSEKANGLGELKGGMIFSLGLPFCRRMLGKKVSASVEEDGAGIATLELLAEKLRFEIAVGRNGKVWVDGEGVRQTLVIGRALQETDEKGLRMDEQRRLAGKLLKDL